MIEDKGQQMWRGFGLSLLLIASPASAATSQGQWRSLPRDFPHEVRAFMERRNACVHWGGEGPTGFKPRDKQIAEAEARLRCEEVDAQERALKKHYAKRPSVLRTMEDSRDWN